LTVKTFYDTLWQDFMTIKENILRLQDDISFVCKRNGRDPKEVTIIGVTKYADIPAIQEAVNCGVVHIAENRVQEAREKFLSPQFPKEKLTRHMIGHLQTNKVKEALKFFDVIQSVDSLKLAEAIDRSAWELKRSFEVLIQVNTSGEAQKSGVAYSEAMDLIKSAVALKNIRVSGLMTMAPQTKDKGAVRDCFRKTRELRNQIKAEFSDAKNIQMNFLSMGMSSDYDIALEEGSNMVRIGSCIFKHE